MSPTDTSLSLIAIPKLSSFLLIRTSPAPTADVEGARLVPLRVAGGIPFAGARELLGGGVAASVLLVAVPAHGEDWGL